MRRARVRHGPVQGVHPSRCWARRWHLGRRSACNMRLRFRQHKRVAMGLSDVAGWGSFLLVRCAPLPLASHRAGTMAAQHRL